MRRKTTKNHPFLVIGLVLVTLIASSITFLYLTNPALFWKSYSSGRAGFSFKYPSGWKVSQCSKKMVFQFENRIEEINFSSDCMPNARINNFGYIVVNRIDWFTDPKQFVEENYSDWNYETKQMGKEKAYVLTPKSSNSELGGQFGSTQKEYLVIKPPLVYIIGVTNPNFGYKKDKDLNMNTFEKILSTFEVSE